MIPKRLVCFAPVLALAMAGCFKSPGTPSTGGGHCVKNEDCPTGQRCAAGACVSGCRGDADCPNDGVCHPDGTCGTRPECTLDTDCPATFACQAGRCACTTDYACWTRLDGGVPDTSLVCVSGACEQSNACTSDSECSDGRYCGPAGFCTAPCLQNSDCGGATQLGGALTCDNGRCTSPCLVDSAPNGGQGGCKDGQICSNGLCTPSQCATFTDCGDPTLYCTSATHGRCAPVRACDPSVPDTCGPLAECTTWPPDQCPPGFDCSESVCVDEQPCLTDQQCTADQVCEFGGCRTAPACQTVADCPSGDDCLGGHCLVHVCRGPADCTGSEICSGGQCVQPAAGSDIASVRLLTPLSTLEVGQTRQLAAVALTATGVSEPVGHFDWSVAPSSVASISAGGLLTALAAGQATVTVGFTRPDATQATPDQASFTVVVAPASGRAVVVDATSGAPIAGAQVRLCQGYDGGGCVAPTDLVTDATGAATFTSPSGAYDLSAQDPALDSSGKPVHDIVHLLGITAIDVLVPLPRNAAGAAAGFTGSIDFSAVQSTGGVRVGLAGSSIADLASFDVQDLVGQPWVSTSTVDLGSLGPFGLGGNLPTLDGGTIRVPMTGGSVADVDQLNGLPVSIRIKDGIYALGTPGVRTLWSFAGRVDAQLFFGSYGSSLSTGAVGGVLPFFGAFDHGLRAAVDEPLLPELLDQSDLDGNGVCEDQNICQSSGQYLPDYTNFPSRNFKPAQPQSLRVEVLTPASPDTAGQVILLAGAQIPGPGLLPLGMTSAQGGPGTGDVVMRMAPLYGGFEATGYALLALATPGGGNGALDGGAPTGNANGLSVAVARDATLPQQVDLSGAMLPFIQNAHYDPASRLLAAGDTWPAIAPGASLVRLTLVGSTQRVYVYASPTAATSGLYVPPAPGGSDPAMDPAVAATLVALQLPAGDDLDAVSSLPGDTLLDLSNIVQRFTRAPLQ